MSNSIKPILLKDYFQTPSDLNLVKINNRIHLVDIVDSVQRDIFTTTQDILDYDDLSSRFVGKDLMESVLNLCKSSLNPVTSLICDTNWTAYPNKFTTSNHYCLVEFAPVEESLRLVITRDGSQEASPIIPKPFDQSFDEDEMNRLESDLDSMLNTIKTKGEASQLVEYGDISNNISFISLTTPDTVLVYDNQGEPVEGDWTPITLSDQSGNKVQMKGRDILGTYPSNGNDYGWYLDQARIHLPLIDLEQDILEVTIRYIMSDIDEIVTYPTKRSPVTFPNTVTPIIFTKKYLELFKCTYDNNTVLTYNGNPISYGSIRDNCVKVLLAVNNVDRFDYKISLGDVEVELTEEGLICYASNELVKEYYISECRLIKFR